MVETKDIEKLFDIYIQNKEYIKCDTLYVWTKFELTLWDNSFRNIIQIRYAVNAEEILKKIENDLKLKYPYYVLKKDEILNDTKERIETVIVKFFKTKGSVIFYNNTKLHLKDLGKSGRRLAYIFYRKLSLDFNLETEFQVGRGDRHQLKISFQDRFPEELYDFSTGERELIKIGLLNIGSWSSKRYDYFLWQIPCYAEEIWRSLPAYLDLSEFVSEGNQEAREELCFWIYEDKLKTTEIKIHYGCEHRRHPEQSTKTTQWHGPFHSLEEAQKEAEMLTKMTKNKKGWKLADCAEKLQNKVSEGQIPASVKETGFLKPSEEAGGGLKVFVSYCEQDFDDFQIPKVCAMLSQKPEIQHVFYWDKDKNSSKYKSISDYESKSISESKFIIVFFHNKTKDAPGVKEEIRLAKEGGKDIIPVFMSSEEDIWDEGLRVVIGVKFNTTNLDKFIETIYLKIT